QHGSCRISGIRFRTLHAGDMTYPETSEVDWKDVYHGVEVADPFRWLEDDTSVETAAWVAEQNAVTFAYLRDIPCREAYRARLTELWNYTRFGCPEKRGDRYFFFRNDGLQNQSVLYVGGRDDRD